jgi:tetratricopeptide (TPR) repeat protein
MTSEPAQLEAQGKRAFADKSYNEAADFFRQAAEGYTLGHEGGMAAEMMNNASVALLQAGKPQESLSAVLGTEEIFQEAKDIKRQAMALGNKAAALEALNRTDEAIEAYELSAELFRQVDEGDLRAMVMKSGAALKLKSGKITESAFKMMGSLEAKQTPGIFERILRFFLRFIK